MEVLLLGPMRVVESGRAIDLGPRRAQRCLFGLLALEAGQTVPLDRLADLLWDGDPPGNARGLIRSHVSRLRSHLGGGRAGVRIVTHGPGYMAQLDPDQVDAQRFRRQVAEADAVPGPADRAAHLRRALGLWRGPLLADVASDRLRDRVGAGLDELRLHAWESCLDAELAAGEHLRITTELVDLAAAHPLRERLAHMLMLALYRGDRQAEALAVFRDLRARMVRELGLEPGEALQRLEHAILVNDASLLPPAPVTVVSGPSGQSQLPADVRGFLGRDTELAQLDEQVRGGSTVATVVGPPGVGKTALAIHWAHAASGRYPDGRLFIDFRGYGPGAALGPMATLDRLLRTLGCPGADVATDPDERAAQYRALLAGKRVLIVVDNVASSQDVTPLLPGDAGSLMLVTSRERLDGLAALHGATRLTLAPLSTEDSAGMLERFGGLKPSRRIGRHLRALAHLCDRMPLALRIAAVRLGESGPESLVEQLRAEGGRLGRLSVEGGEVSVRAAISLSLHRLADTERAMFCLLGLHPGPRPSLDACAALADVPTGAAGASLGGLTAAHLVQEFPSAGYQMHDLVRLFAREQAGAMDTAQTGAAVRRVLMWYRDAANAADRALRPAERPNFATPPVSLAFGSPAAALAWLDTEADNLIAAAERACDHHPELGWQIAAAMYGWLSRRHQRDQWIALYGRAAEAAREAGDAHGEALIAGRMPMPCSQAGRHEEAAGWARRAHELRMAMGDLHGAATALLNLGAVWNNARRPWAAISALQRAARLGEGLPNAEHMRAIIQCNLGEAHQLAGLTPLALKHFERALSIADGVCAPRDVAQIRIGLAAAFRGDGRPREAIARLERVLDDLRQTGDAVLEAEAHEELGRAHLDAGEPGPASRHLASALAAYRRLGHHRSREVEELTRRLHAGPPATE